jgi:hypothetical protein
MASGLAVEDRHKGPLNNQGKPTKNAKHGLTHEPKAHTRYDHDPGGPRRPPGWHGGRPLGRGLPRSRVRRSHEQNSPCSRAQHPLGRGPPRSRSQRPLGRGPPRSRAQCPLGEDRLARGHLHARRPRSCPLVRAFNALTPQEARHDPDTAGNRVPALFHQLSGEGHPRHCVALCDEAGVSPVTLCRLPPYG